MSLTPGIDLALSNQNVLAMSRSEADALSERNYRGGEHACQGDYDACTRGLTCRRGGTSRREVHKDRAVHICKRGVHVEGGYM